MTEYQITKEQCQASISGVCPGCGGEVTPLETVDNADNPTFWSGCEKCCVFTEGCPPHIQQLARKLVEEGTLEPYTTLDKHKLWHNGTPEEREFWLSRQTAGASRILRRILMVVAGAS